MPSWLQGHDKEGRPIAWRLFGKLEIWKLLEKSSFDKVLLYHVWETEQAIRAVEEASAKAPFNIETFVVVLDMEGWG